MHPQACTCPAKMEVRRRPARSAVGPCAVCRSRSAHIPAPLKWQDHMWLGGCRPALACWRRSTFGGAGPEPLHCVGPARLSYLDAGPISLLPCRRAAPADGG